MDLSPDDDNFQGRLLHQAALWDNVELLQELISSGADVEARDCSGRTALHAAALADRSRCLAALCRAGAEVDARPDHAAGGKTALHIAAERGHVENVRVLLRAGADLSARDAAGDSALDLADRNNWRHAANELRDHRDALERERLSQHSALRELVSRGDVAQLKARLAALGNNAGLIVNMTPGGANTLLYVASESGQCAAVGALLAVGADGRAHPATRYGPLYIACYHGHLDVARTLLQHFPEAVQQETVEKWLPLHAACMGGHASLVSLLLDFHYPEHLLVTYTERRSQQRYLCPVDVNARDAAGHTPLSRALHCPAAVDALLAFSVPVLESEESVRDAGKTSSPQRGLAHGIHAIVAKLTAASRQETESVRRVHPVDADVAVGGDSCLARAVRAGDVRLVRRLLQAGAAPDAPATLPQESEKSREVRRRSRSTSALSRASSAERETEWTALALATRCKQVSLAEVLLAGGASDPRGLAAREAARGLLPDLLAKLLATKAYPDPEYKLNRSQLSEAVLSARDGDSALSYSAACPSVPVMITWRDLQCQLATLKMQWVGAACMRVNPRVGGARAALMALTRLDVSGNDLTALPPELMTLASLRYLNAAQNKLDCLPRASDAPAPTRSGRKPKAPPPAIYTAPVLQELYLQDNRLEELPPELFQLPALQTLDVSNNKLRVLPAAMWTAPALKDLNAAFNLLRDLPTGDEDSCNKVQKSPASGPRSPDAKGQKTSPSESSSRSPSIEHSESESGESDDSPVVIANRSGNTMCSDSSGPHSWRGAVCGGGGSGGGGGGGGGGGLRALSVAHNQLGGVPAALACRAPNLHRLNMAYNSLRSMSYVTSYPTSLRQLDLSHNEITCWPSLPQIETYSSAEGDPLACYCPTPTARPRPKSGGSVRTQLLNAACPARRHLRLEGLRTLILSNNLLTRIQLTTDDDGEFTEPTLDQNDDEWGSPRGLRAKLLFPLLSMLDVSCNLLRSIPPSIHELTNLAVLNISGNKDITELPPQLGLLSRLWSLSAEGCGLGEPLRSMVRAGGCRARLVGLLRAQLTAARPYARLRLVLAGAQGIGKTSLLECLRQESAIHHRRKPTDHWAKRMGNKASRGNLSTVGVDIGTWVYEKPRSNRGPITFRTWDFGGQKEYYATHQYFLSRRSLYLVVWKVTDGRKGLAEALNWLRSIQARAPGSHVIMVATHYDQVGNCKLPESESPEALQRVVRGSVMGAPDADKRGLPRVADSLEVSCSTRHNIRLLADIIYSVAFSIKTPGSKEPLLLTPVPASFVALEECVVQLARDLQHPVLTHHQYTAQVTQYMQQKNLRMFRDAAELHQATMFLHENGILLHYDDATLKELYFLNPQWLCDLLAHVVTVREINPFVNNGVMRTEDLSLVFKASPLLGGGEEGLALLHKFELALGWDPRLLLVPPLLPDRAPPTPQLWLRTRSRGSRGTPHRAWPAAGTGLTPVPPLKEPDSSAQTSGWQCAGVSVEGRAGAGEVRRVVLLSYVPRGFWPRLTARLLAHPACTHLAHALYSPPPELELDETVSKALELNWGWTLWKTGMRLSCGELTLLNLQELDGEANGQDVCYNDKYRVWSEGGWGELEAGCWARVELHLPAHTAVLRRQDSQPIAGYQSISLEPNPEVLAKVLASVTDHIDLLLEDWYPSLGTRFVHTSEGRCLITRLATCPQCARDSAPPHPPLGPDPLLQELRQMGLGVDVRPRVSADSRTSDGDSGVGAESNASSRVGSVEGVVEEGGEGREWGVCAWPLEECILAACGGRPLACPRHPALQLRDLAPDTLLLDVEEERRARWEQVSRGSVVGRGAFGTVLAGTWRPRPGRAPLPVAIKVLQPVPPPAGADVAAHQAYKAGLSRWRREPVSAACRAYCGLRQELAVLVSVHHPHVVPLLAVCPRPLALLLAVAPRGALDGMLREYRGRGVRVGERAVRAIALQLARALEYLHSNRILYRDLKSENVLVWSMPAPQDAQAAELSAAPIDLHIKLGDYGISRSSLPSGTKGFGGTEGFMAPEIMRYNGEEEYNEKVDCFSYGMVLYELLSLRQPFEGHEAVKEAILEGTRPALTARELWYPCNMVETMRRCWSGRADGRPSAGALVSLVAAPEWLALATVATCNTAATGATCNTAASGATCNTAASGANCNTEVTAAVAVPIADTADEPGGWEVWRGGEGRAHSLLAARTGFTRQHTLPLHTEDGAPVTVTAMCRVGSKLWLGDSSGDLSVYSASSCALCWRVRVCVVVGAPPSPAAALQPLAPPRLALALRSGRLFLVSTQRPADEGSFVLTELGTATELCCLAAVYTPIGVEVWAGGDGLHAYRVSAGGVCGADSLSTCSVRHLAAHSRTPLILAAGTGPCVYQWSAVTREQTAKLDCSKLVPCSESLRSLEDLPADQGQITALCVVGGRVYVGVGGGVLLVADAASLRPLTVCRPYREHISCIVPLISHEGSPGPHMVATFGTDYRPLLQRFAPHHQEKDVYPGTYCLLWRAHHWLPD